MGRGLVFSDSLIGAGFYIHPAVKKIILNVLFSIRLNQKYCASRVTEREGLYIQEILFCFCHLLNNGNNLHTHNNNLTDFEKRTFE